MIWAMQLPPKEAFNIRPMSRQTRELLLREELAGSVPSDPRMAHQILHTRDKGICGICGTPVDWALRHPHPGSATMDHILHKSRRGSTHTWENLRLAHRQCNLERNQFEIAPDVARERLRRAIRRYTHPEIYLPMNVEKATVEVDRLEKNVLRCKAVLAKQQSVAKQRSAADKAPTWRLQTAVEEAERAELYLRHASQRLQSVLRELVAQYTADTVAAQNAT